MDEKEGNPFREDPISDAALLCEYHDLMERLAGCRREIETRMIERNAVAIPSDVFLCEMPKRYTYFEQKFTPLKEVLSGSELAACWQPAWDEVIPEHLEKHPESWHTNKVLAVARRHGDEAMRIVEGARNEGRGSLTFKLKIQA